MKRITWAVSGLAIAVAPTAPPASAQVSAQVERGAALTTQFCTSHAPMQTALFVFQPVGIGGFAKSAAAPVVKKTAATDRQATKQLGKVHNRLMLALRGERPGQSAAISVGKPGTMLRVIPAPGRPSPELVQASLANLTELCDLHIRLHEVYTAGATPEAIRSLRGQIEIAPRDCPHSA